MKILLTYFFLFVTLCSLAQHRSNEFMQYEIPLFEDISNGRNEKRSRQIIEDSEGYIWIGTTNGIERYDGIEYIQFGKNNERNDIISALCEDPKGNRIYATISQRDELIYIDKNDYSVHYVPFATKEFKNNTITSIAPYNDSLLVFKNFKGIFLINKNNGYIKGPFNTRKASSISSPILNIKGKLYTSSTGYLEVIDERLPDTIIIRTLDTKGYKIKQLCLFNDSIIMLSVNPKISLVDDVLAQYNINDGSFKVIHKMNTFCHFMQSSTDGVWFGATARPLHFYNIIKDSIFCYDTQNTNINDNKASGLLKLRNQPILFVSSPDDGLCKVDYNCSKFNVIDLRRYSSATSGRIFSVIKDSHGDIWTWSLNGLFRRKKGTLRFEKVQTNNPKLSDQRAIYKIVEDTTPHQEALYFMKGDYVHSYSFATGKFYDLPIRLNDHISGIFFSNGLLYCVGQKGNIVIYNPRTTAITRKSYDYEQTGRIQAAHLDGDSVIWLGNDMSQIFKFNIADGKTSHQATTGMLDEHIMNITERIVDGQREIWIAAKKNGLFCYLPEKRHLSHIENCQMLRQAVVNVAIDNCNNVWASTPSGLVCQSFKDRTVHEYGSNLKLDIDYMSTVQYKTTDGTIIFGGVNHLVEFNSSETIEDNDYYPTPKIVSYQYFNATSIFYDEMTEKTIYNVTDTINVPKGVRSVRLNARILNHSLPKNNTIMWRMPSLADNWLTINTTTPIFCSVLNHGINVIELQSCDSHGKPTGNIRTLYINKEVFFYEHPAFRVLTVIMGILLFIALLIYRSNKEKQRRRMLEAEVERQSGEIIKTNEQLIISQARIEQQNTELRNHRAVLEREVADRTADLETARQKAEESSRLKSAFLANLSHEVRTPMNCIVGFSKLLVDPSCTREEQIEFAHLIQESSNGMLVLIGDLLDVSRIESGQLRVNFGDFNLMKELDDVYRMLFVERKNTNVDFELHADSELQDIILHSDKDRFRQIIINITYNAFKFTEMGHVYIHANKCYGDELKHYSYPDDMPPVEGDVVLIRIKDSGIGIPADKLDVIFEPFRKLNNNKTLYPGLGLGLNIVKNLVRLLHGQIWVTSVVGQGTTFHFFLPL